MCSVVEGTVQVQVLFASDGTYTFGGEPHLVDGTREGESASRRAGPGLRAGATREWLTAFDRILARSTMAEVLRRAARCEKSLSKPRPKCRTFEQTFAVMTGKQR